MRAQHYGRLAGGRSVELYRLGTPELELGVITYGGRIVSLRTPDRSGLPGDVVLGYGSLQGYLDDTSYHGALIGRYANRIANALFALGGRRYELAKNDGEHSLHGGTCGFDKRLWQAKAHGESLELYYRSAPGEEGFPGGLDVSVLYTVCRNELRIDYSARADAETVVNLTNHMYFNLTAHFARQIVEHELVLQAHSYTPVTATLVPTGELRDVRHSPFDFRQRAAIGGRIDADHEQLRFAGGYDHNWILFERRGTLDLAAAVYEPSSGRRMEVMTSEPGVQFYSGNQLSQPAPETGRAGHGFRCGFCLETQHFPDSPNHSNFPSTRLAAGRTYTSSTVYRFWAR
jgi:aldose 1-epimerase